MSYIQEQCFPIADLTQKIKDDFFPFVKIASKSISKIDKKERLQLTMKDDGGRSIKVDLLISVTYEENKPTFHVNKRSYENAVVREIRRRELEKELSKSLNSLSTDLSI